jgi:hypothetical protein
VCDSSFDCFEMDDLRPLEKSKVDQLPTPHAWIADRLHFYKRPDGFGFIGWGGSPAFWFSRLHVDDPELMKGSTTPAPTSQAPRSSARTAGSPARARSG